MARRKMHTFSSFTAKFTAFLTIFDPKTPIGYLYDRLFQSLKFKRYDPFLSGIPTYCAPSLRRSTIERTAISRKLAEEACSKGVIKTGEPLKATGNYLQVTDTPLSIKDDASRE